MNTTKFIKVAPIVFVSLFCLSYSYAGDSHAKAFILSAEKMACDHVVASTDTGPVVGLRAKGLNKFLGIPYAAPPVGDLRWQPPQPPTRWHGLRDATQFANHCPQLANFFGLPLPSTTEDCLYLNVYTPADRGWHKGRGHPVMVWIHGGAFVVGLSDTFDPTKLVDEDVVVVTLNYRLGILGYLAHPALSAESPDDASGNYGFLDQQAALDWVRRNIKHFGGNPDNVTIFGESAGGLSVHTQLASPLAAGLFDRAIIQSGAYQLNTATLTVAESRGSNFAASVGCATAADVAACLRALPVATLLAYPLAGQIAAPNVGGKVLTQSIGAALQNGQFNRVPVMEGSNHDEYRLFVEAFFELPTGTPTNITNYPTRVNAAFGSVFDATTLSYIVNTVYPFPAATYPAPSIALGTVGTDGLFACNSRTSIRRMAKFVPVFAYEFNDQNAPELFWPPDTISGMPYGAAHASEIQYIFNLPQSGQNPLNTAQELLSGEMVRYWTRFARFGNPNSFFTHFWPQYNPTKDIFRSLNTQGPTTESGFATDHKCGFWAPGS